MAVTVTTPDMSMVTFGWMPADSAPVTKKLSVSMRTSGEVIKLKPLAEQLVSGVKPAGVISRRMELSYRQ